MNKIILEEEYVTFDEIKNYITKFNHIYGIKINLKKTSIGSRFYMK
jgi:hypothetical protein